MKYYRKVTGKNVYLSPMNIQDVDKYVKWFNDLEITDRLNQSANICNEYGEKEWIEKNLLKSSSNFAIVKTEDDTLIGNCGLDKVDHISRKATIGIFIINSNTLKFTVQYFFWLWIICIFYFHIIIYY